MMYGDRDLWQYLKASKKPILMYGMGNGADTILSVCEQKGIEVADFFASDGFVRGHSFHGKRVKSYSEACDEYGDFIVLLSFGTSLSDVMDNIRRIAAEQELYAPDVAQAGNELFSIGFAKEHYSEICQARELLCDEASRHTFDNIIKFKLTGMIQYLDGCPLEKSPYEEILHPHNYCITADLGAYNGDTVRKLLEFASPQTVIAAEPDPRTYKRLCKYAAEENRCRVETHNACVWSDDTELCFSSDGSKGSGLNVKGSGKGNSISVSARRPDGLFDGRCVDFIKYDVEGAEARALEGSVETIKKYHPELLVSVYHRSEDIFSLPIKVKSMLPEYKLYMRKAKPGYPAWDVELYAVVK